MKRLMVVMVLAIALCVGLGSVALADETLEVDVDIKPGSDPNSINCLSHGVVPVAILSSDTFDAADVDPSTLAFGPNGAAPAHLSGGHLEDVDGAGLDDLVSHYYTALTEIQCGHVGACVTGETFDGLSFWGCDSIVTEAPRN